MGDGRYSYYDCPKCGAKWGVEIYDAPSCMLYVGSCQYCDYKVDLDYYETDPDTLELLSSEDAKKRGLVTHNDDESIREPELGD